MPKLIIFTGILMLTSVCQATTITAIGAQSFSDFTGKGLSPGGGTHGQPGTLDSNQWQILGASQGDSQFANTYSSGDFARGQSIGGVSAGGLYMFALPDGQHSLGLQATSADFTPGALIWKLANRSQQWLGELTLDFEFWWNNNGSKGSRISTFAQTSNVGWTPLPGTSMFTPGAADDLGWLKQIVRLDLSPMLLAPDGALAFRWQFEDLAGGRSRDEIAFANLSARGTIVTPNFPPETLPLTDSTPPLPQVELATPPSLWLALPLLGLCWPRCRAKRSPRVRKSAHGHTARL